MPPSGQDIRIRRHTALTGLSVRRAVSGNRSFQLSFPLNFERKLRIDILRDRAYDRISKVRFTMNESSQWRVVLERNNRFDGAFVYGVRSTGVYCRPSCPSRRPKRNQVIFFSAPTAAEKAGFRPCRRCQPGNENGDHTAAEKVKRACRYMNEHPEQMPTLAALGAHVGSSPYHLHRVFKRITGITPRQYFDASRLNRLKSQLRKRDNVLDAMYEAGYNSTSRLYERGPSQLGMTPGAYRKGGKDARIRYAIVTSPLGRLLVAVTERGVCSVSLGDSDSALENALRSEYPAADIHRQDEALKQCVREVLRRIDGKDSGFRLPLDMQATAFQWRVWQLLLSIPCGGTRSYSEIAQALGRPSAARAVARACASNPVALLIPCHRVVRKNGDPGGYRWGAERKRILLLREKSRYSAQKRSERRSGDQNSKPDTMLAPLR